MSLINRKKEFINCLWQVVIMETIHEYKNIMISTTVFNQHENVLAEARFKLTPSGFRSAALPISPTGIGGEFYLLKYMKHLRDNLTLIHERMYSLSILYQNHPQRNYMNIKIS